LILDGSDSAFGIAFIGPSVFVSVSELGNAVYIPYVFEFCEVGDGSI
jgi:hypothetical protein